MGPDGWLALLGTVGLALCWGAWKRWLAPLVQRWSSGVQAKTISVSGIGFEIGNTHPSHVQDREDGFAFQVTSGSITTDGESVRLSCKMLHRHPDGSTPTARCTAAGVLLGGYAYVIYTTTEDPPHSGRWTGCGILRLTASGRAMGWWITEDIYQPGFFQSGISRFWPAGASPDSTEEDV